MAKRLLKLAGLKNHIISVLRVHTSLMLVDDDLKRRLEIESNEIHDRMTKNENKAKTLSQKEAKMRAKEPVLSQEKSELMTKKKELIDLYGRLKSISQKAGDIGLTTEVKKASLLRIREEPHPDDKIAELQSDLERHCRKRVVKARKLKDLQTECASNFHDRTLSILESIQCQAKIASIERQMQQYNDAVQTAKSEYERVLKILKDLKALARMSHEALKARKVTSPPELLPLFEVEVEESIEELDEALAQAQARADLASDINPQILVDFNQRKKQIRELEIKYQTKLQDVEDMRAGMQEMKDTWTSRLNEIIESISESFARAFDSIINLIQVSDVQAKLK